MTSFHVYVHAALIVAAFVLAALSVYGILCRRWTVYLAPLALILLGWYAFFFWGCGNEAKTIAAFLCFRAKSIILAIKFIIVADMLILHVVTLKKRRGEPTPETEIRETP